MSRQAKSTTAKVREISRQFYIQMSLGKLQLAIYDTILPRITQM